MAKYIPLEPLVAEIERLKADALQKKGQCKRSGLERIMHQIGAYNKILSFLDTLEVKEVDLEKEIDKFYGMYRKNGKTYSTEDNEECLDWKVDCNPNFVKAFAKHFFELGMQASNKTQKGE